MFTINRIAIIITINIIFICITPRSSQRPGPPRPRGRRRAGWTAGPSQRGRPDPDEHMCCYVYVFVCLVCLLFICHVVHFVHLIQMNI